MIGTNVVKSRGKTNKNKGKGRRGEGGGREMERKVPELQ